MFLTSKRGKIFFFQKWPKYGLVLEKTRKKVFNIDKFHIHQCQAQIETHFFCEFFLGGTPNASIFQSVFDLQEGKNIVFPKVAQIWSSLRKDKKKFLTFSEIGGGSQTLVNFFLTFGVFF